MSAFQRLGLDPLLIEAKHQYSETQEQTQNTFAFKWSKRDTYESEAVKSETKRWLFERYCDNKPELVDEWLAGDRKIILDAGCGSSFSALLFFGGHLKNHDYLGIDISSAVDIAKTRFQEIGYPGEFLQVSLLEIPIEDESIDIIFSEGVLHHTDNTATSIKYLANKLRKGGRFLFYVYAKKAVIREFTDDCIREQLQKLSDEEAWEALKPLTKLGIELGKLNIEINVPEDIPFLKIGKGKMDLQRFFYWNICKLFYRPEYSLEEMNHINFDWFRPLNCHRHTKEEIISYCDNANLMIERINVQESGITVVARKL
jgi:SAM-dependent methyltransferase